MPSVRGSKRVVVAILLVSSAAATGAIAGFAAGVALTPVSARLHTSLAARVTLVAGLLATVALDRFVTPVSARRQVPQLWGRIFSPSTTAVLYGARLGVGPLTILRTWWWWVSFVAGALAGVWPSTAVGALFGASRIVVMLGVGTRAGGIRARERAVVLLGPMVALAVGVAVVAGAGVDSSSRKGPVATRGAEPACADACASARIQRADGTARSALLPPPVDAVLAATLPDAVGDGFARVPDDEGGALGALDLARAAAAERDASAERALLETRRFVAGHARAWRHDDGRLAYATAYRFGSAGDAEAYLVDGFITLEGRGARIYDVEDPPHAKGFSQAESETSGGEVAHGVAFVRGELFFLVFETSSASSASADGAQRLARVVDRWHVGNG